MDQNCYLMVGRSETYLNNRCALLTNRIEPDVSGVRQRVRTILEVLSRPNLEGMVATPSFPAVDYPITHVGPYPFVPFPATAPFAVTGMSNHSDDEPAA
jgi:hypothetical protein